MTEGERAMSLTGYDLLKTLPIGSDFQTVSEDSDAFRLDRIKAGEDETLGRFNAAAYMRIQEAERVRETLDTLLQGNKITLDMAKHVQALPLDGVFGAQQSLIALASGCKHSADAFISTASFNKTLEEFGLPVMQADL